MSDDRSLLIMEMTSDGLDSLPHFEVPFAAPFAHNYEIARDLLEIRQQVRERLRRWFLQGHYLDEIVVDAEVIRMTLQRRVADLEVNERVVLERYVDLVRRVVDQGSEES